MPIVGIIPARGGSKALPKKSIVLCAGRPLLAYTCQAALESRMLDRVYLSTDDEEIASVAKGCGVEVPFLRPAELAADDTPMVEVLRHALAWLERQGQRPRALALLQPTSPLRHARHIDEAIEMFTKTGADSVVSVTEIPHQFSPVSALNMNGDSLAPYMNSQPLIARRQDKPKVYARNGPAILVVSKSTLERGELYGSDSRGYFMPRECSIDVDDAMDLAMAECLMRAERA